ncbi:MAG: hypothetical protein QME96_06620 [Myxococcota bacterium]|nr:hypothetical protein [Myxococcota bacterium]
MSCRAAAGCYVICLSNRRYKASLIVRKVYVSVSDSDAERHGLLRVIDESGEDYLFPKSLFAAIDLPKDVHQRPAI